MCRKFLFFILLLACSLANAASLSERLAASTASQEVFTVEVAAGKPGKGNWEIVPSITEKLPASVVISRVESEGSIQTMQALCADAIKAGIVQADAFVRYMEVNDCTKRPIVLGNPLYPYYAYLVVKADNSASSFDDLVKRLSVGQVLKIAAGGAGSGGEATLRTLLDSNQAWKTVVSIEKAGKDVAPSMVADGTLDAFFVMDELHSSLIKDLAGAEVKGNKVYKFLEINLPEDLKGTGFSHNSFYLYGEGKLSGGWFASTTVSTPAVFVVNDEYYQANPKPFEAVRKAIADAGPSIAAKVGVPGDWIKTFKVKK